MQMAFSDSSQPVLLSGPGPGGQSGSSLGNSREAVLESSPEKTRKSRGDCGGLLGVHKGFGFSLPHEETEAGRVGSQPSPSPNTNETSLHHPHNSYSQMRLREDEGFLGTGGAAAGPGLKSPHFLLPPRSCYTWYQVEVCFTEGSPEVLQGCHHHVGSTSC